MRIKPESIEDLTELFGFDCSLPDGLFWRFKWRAFGMLEAQIRRPGGYFLLPSRCVVNGHAYMGECDNIVKKTASYACGHALNALNEKDAREAVARENYWKDFNGDFKKRGC